MSSFAATENIIVSTVYQEDEEIPESDGRIQIRPRTGDVCKTVAGVYLRKEPSLDARSLKYLDRGTWVQPDWESPITDDGYTWRGVTAFTVNDQNKITSSKYGYIRDNYYSWKTSGRISNGYIY